MKTNTEWIKLNLPYGPAWDKNYANEKDSFSKRGLNKPGTLIETKTGKFLIGHINPLKGVCDDCTEFSDETIVKRYKIIPFE